eukprot:427609_1
MDGEKVKLILSHWLPSRQQYEKDILDIIIMFYPNGCWMLERSIPYMARLVIGIYSTENKLIEAKEKYIGITKGNDPHKCSYTNPNIENELEITRKFELDFISSGQFIYVIGDCRSSSMCGTIRKYVEFCTKEHFDEKYKDCHGFNPLLMAFQVWHDYMCVVVDAEPQSRNKAVKFDFNKRKK